MQMTQEQKRIKLAEAGGWKKLKGFSDSGWPLLRTPPEKPNKEGYLEAIPDYLNDLNAVHELELKVFQDSSFQLDYSRSLIRIIKNLSPLCKQFFTDFDLVTATAAQRCEALGLTLKLWEQ